MRFVWSTAVSELAHIERLVADSGISNLLARCLLNRGISTSAEAKAYLEPRLADLSDPFELQGMRDAVLRLFQALEKGERLVIFGDYDVDGVTSTALLTEVLAHLGWNVDAYLPHRLDEGYGLTRDAVENCLRKLSSNLLLAVDCGSTSNDVIRGLQESGIDVIVLDHHQPSSPPPAAHAIINPHLKREAGTSLGPPGRAGGLKELCSVGLSFKLAHALIKHGRTLNLPEAISFDLRPLLDLVALGTIADMVPLCGENRILVSSGMQRLKSTVRPGIVALKQVAQCSAEVTPHEVGFQLAPRLNATGRLETAEQSLRLLRCTDLPSAHPLARTLDQCNRDRQAVERELLEESLATVRSRFNPAEHFVIVEGHPRWHIGVVGIIASRILQQFYRPTIILGGDGTVLRGSGRSVDGFDLGAALQACSDLLIRHGGHAMAAGVTIDPANLEDFRVKLNGLARIALHSAALKPTLRLDGEVRLAEMSLAAVRELTRMNPMGQGNPTAQFWTRSVTLARPARRMGAEQQHAKLWLTDGPATCEAVWWKAPAQMPDGRFDVAFAPEVNDFGGRMQVQLKILDWRPTDTT